ncbi:uncharacterized protein V1516DRAFT_620387 [Lipomyces oligophaga]|uniref:uncharacterized protein n=1 Tax=Lipomyces oligophaga TaxID=45792 RepID=UPI0034CF902F
MRSSVVVLGSVAAGAVSYALYFDYKRRHSPEFRRKLRKAEKQYQISLENQSAAQKEDLKRSIIRSLAEQPISINSMQDAEAAIMSEIKQIEEYARYKIGTVNDAVISMYRLLLIHPSPPQIMAALKESYNEVCVTRPSLSNHN